ncbi:MAG TPA: F0F1 ATP synthase subunit B [Gemmataceae bacterium]|nr:F0F1 ATP synthase subunit B [Gemmataceae bacterium]
MVRGWRGAAVVGLTLVLLVGVPGLAWAEGDVEGAPEKVNILSPRFDLGIWTVVVFGVLFLVLWKWAWGPMLQGLQNRERNIQGAIAEAQKAREEAQRLQEQWQQEMARAQEKVREIHDDARRRAQQNTDEMIAKARADIQAERERLRREIETARDQALQELWKHTAQLATEISAKAIRRQLSPDDHRRLVDEALADLPGAGKVNGSS